MAPSKLFIIPEKVYLPRDEQRQVDHWKFNYESDMLSIAAYCREHYYLPSRSAGGLTPEQVAAEEVQHRRRLEENNEENKRIAALREERKAAEKQRIRQDLVKQVEQQKREEELRRIENERLVQQEVLRSSFFITKETLLSAIDDALSHPITYDFAIDKYGNLVTENNKIHVQAFRASDVPDVCENSKTMIDATNVKLKATKIY